MKLIDAPIGIFQFDGELVLKTEYKSENRQNGKYIPDCYIVRTGEYFWGGAKTANELNNLDVEPIDFAELLPTVTDTISRQAAIDALMKRDKELRNINWYDKPYAEGECRGIDEALAIVSNLPSAQPEIIRCKDCIYYDPPHVENNGVRYEYDEMPADAFDALGTGLVNAEYGINIGGRCCVDYYCKNYSDDKRVFVREDNYCGRAERRTDE